MCTRDYKFCSEIIVHGMIPQVALEVQLIYPKVVGMCQFIERVSCNYRLCVRRVRNVWPASLLSHIFRMYV